MKAQELRDRINLVKFVSHIFEYNCEYSETSLGTMPVSKTLSSFASAHPAWTIAILLCFTILIIYYQVALKPKRAKLPVYSNHSGLFASWYDALDYVRDSPGVLARGYEKASERWSLVFGMQHTDWL